jgi:hypothetical protein
LAVGIKHGISDQKTDVGEEVQARMNSVRDNLTAPSIRADKAENFSGKNPLVRKSAPPMTTVLHPNEISAGDPDV